MEFDRKKIEKEAEKNLPRVRGNLIKGNKVMPLTNENVKITVATIAGLEKLKEEGEE